jgi:hypothetical protein
MQEGSERAETKQWSFSKQQSSWKTSLLSFFWPSLAVYEEQPQATQTAGMLADRAVPGRL